MKKLIYLTFLLCITTMMGACDNSDDNRTTYSNPNYTQFGSVFTNVPDPQDAVIYQVNLRAFSQQGTLSAVTDRLDDIKALGANVVYLMPIYPNGIENSAGGLGSPYSVRNYKEVSPEYGTLKDLQVLVEQAHKHDMEIGRAHV